MSGLHSQRLQTRVACLLVLCSCLQAVQAHEHHDHNVDFDLEKLKPIDRVLWLHIWVQFLIWAVVFPVGMVFGLTRSRWHVPVQVTATVVTVGGIWLGHAHGGRTFPHSSHGSFGEWLLWIILAQAGIGIFLKTHVLQESRLRKVVLMIHSILGRLYPVIGYTQMLLGIILGFGFCGGGNLAQCLAHHIMGSSFAGYGLFYLVMAMHGASWLEAYGISQEFFDSTFLMLWGIVNTFTEHNFLETSNGWSHKDMQHTSLGVLFWTGGALGMWLSRNGRRTIWPAAVFALTGFAMAGHEQSSMLSTQVHTIFGYTLMLVGLCRIVEISFILKGSHKALSGNGELNPFQHTTPFLLVAGGFQFMAATEEEISLIGGIGMDHVTYIILIVCVAFVVYLWANMLIALYHSSGRNAPPSALSSDGKPSWSRLFLWGVTSHYGDDTQRNKDVQYEHLAQDRIDSIELGDTRQTRSNRVFDADEDIIDDDGGDSYWSGSGETLGETDAREIRVG